MLAHHFSHYYIQRCQQNSVWIGRCDQPLVPQSHQTFRLFLVVELLKIMGRNICWPTTFHTITLGDAHRWCHKWLEWSAPHAPSTPKTCHPVPPMNLLGIMFRNRCRPTTFHTTYYNRRCRQVVSELAGVNNPSLSQGQFSRSDRCVLAGLFLWPTLTDYTISWTKGTGDNNLTIHTPATAEYIGIWEKQQNQLTFILPITIGSHTYTYTQVKQVVLKIFIIHFFGHKFHICI